MKLSEVIAQIGERELSLWAELCEGLLVREMRAAGMTCTCGIMGESADLAEHTASCAKVLATPVCGWCHHHASVGPCPRWVIRDGIPEPCDCDDPCHKVGGVRA